MASPFAHDPRRARLQELAHEWGVFEPQPVVVYPPTPAPRTSGDDFNAEELLKRRRSQDQSRRNSQVTGFKLSFGTSKKPWDPKEIFEVLDNHVSAGGAPGVADALINKLLFVGGDMNVSNAKAKASLLNRKKSMESMERSQVLLKAIQNRQPEMVAVLVHHADPLTIDTALPLALRSGDPVIVQMLLQRGANTLQTQDGKDAFRQMCITGGQANLVGLILQSGGRPSTNWLSMALVDGTRKGCLETVLRLSRSTSDADYNNTEALKTAISQCRVDLALAILTGAKPPTPGSQGLSESFSQLFGHTAVGPREKMALTEALLCAGAYGDAVSLALSQACLAEFYDMAELLLRYGASIEFQGASIVRHAFSRAQVNLAQLLLSGMATLSPVYASECVTVIPKTISPEDRHALLSLLLRKGANGPPLHEALIDATKACDLQSINLLLTPLFPGGTPVSNGDSRKGSRGMVYDRHDVASVDYKNGLALSTAVRMNNLPLVKHLLAGRPSPATVDLVFPQTNALPSEDRYHMTETFLAAGLTGPCISATLKAVIDEQSAHRDERLIGLLIRHSASANSDDGGASILSAIAIRDLGLLESLLRTPPAHQVLVEAMTRAMAVESRKTRYELVKLLINAGAGREGTEVTTALVAILAIMPVDLQLAALFLTSRCADVNFDSGAAVALAVDDPNPAVLDLVLQRGNPNAESLSQALQTVCAMQTTPAKVTKANAILSKSPPREALNAALTIEVQTVLRCSQDRRNLATVKSLLSAGADINIPKAPALCAAVRGVDPLILDVLLHARPTPESLGAALPLSLNITDPMDRLSFTQKLIDYGAPAEEANRALVYAIGAHPSDLPLFGLLASHAASEVGEALRLAIQRGEPDVVDLILERTPQPYSAAILKAAFQEATKVQSQDKRVRICRYLLRQGVSGEVVSDALLAAASDGDLELGAVLMEYGASVEHHDGQAIVEACAAGAPEVVKMLLASKAEVRTKTLEKGFQSATLVGDLQKRASVFRLLLEKGVSGEVVDIQLVSSAKFGEEGEGLVKLLLDFGASVDYDSGEAIWNATRSAMMGNLRLMLGIGNVRQVKPSNATLFRALKASRKLGRDPRYQVIEWLFEAGMPASEDIHITLNRAVKDDPDLRLIRLLLSHGASPLANGCESLIDAAQLLMPEILAILLGGDVPGKDISWTFQQAFTADTAVSWLSEQGLQVAKVLLEKGAEGEGLSLALSVAIDSFGTDRETIAREFANVLLRYKADVSYSDGLVVRRAAQKADLELIERILQRKPHSRAISMAFPFLFDSDLSEEDTIRLVSLFTDYHNGEERLDVMFSHPDLEPALFRALNKFPRSLRLLETLLNAGFYHDQMTKMQIMEDIEEEEPANLLLWALHQPQKRISSTLIKLLIDRGANVNFESPLSKTTPLLLAVKAKRNDVVGELILAGAEVDVVDVTGNTPMTLATKMRGDVGTSMMSMILAADPSKNDGSLHNAARELDLNALQVLIEHGHDLDFPSTLHGGRSALGELCLNAAHAGPLTASQEKLMEKVMTFLIEKGTDLTVQSDGKSALLLAFHSVDPVPTARALLKVGVWKLVNRPFNYYSDGTYTYSASQYVSRVLPETDHREELLGLLRKNRAIDVYYANEGAQPEGAVNLPEELLRAERERRTREDRIARETEEHMMILAQTKERANIENQIFVARAELEDSRTRRNREEEANALRERHAIEEQAFMTELRRRKVERDEAARHEQKLLESGLSRTRLIADAQMEQESKKQEKLLEWDRQRNVQSVANAQQLSAIRVREREAIDRYDASSDARIVQRIAEQKRLVDSQSGLAAQLSTAGGNPRRQIGFVEELKP